MIYVCKQCSDPCELKTSGKPPGICVKFFSNCAGPNWQLKPKSKTLKKLKKKLKKKKAFIVYFGGRNFYKVDK